MIWDRTAAHTIQVGIICSVAGDGLTQWSAFAAPSSRRRRSRLRRDDPPPTAGGAAAFAAGRLAGRARPRYDGAAARQLCSVCGWSRALAGRRAGAAHAARLERVRRGGCSAEVAMLCSPGAGGGGAAVPEGGGDPGPAGSSGSRCSGVTAAAGILRSPMGRRRGCRNEVFSYTGIHVAVYVTQGSFCLFLYVCQQ